VIYLKESGVKNIIARAETPTQKSVLEKLGVSTVIMPEAEMGLKVAERLVLNRGEQLNLTDELSIFKVPAPDGLIGKTIKEANDIGKYALKLVFLRREYEDQDFSKIIEPTESDVLITDRDFLIILGKQRRMIKMLEDLSE
jgi:trk system potassium uptake protein TrkA